MRIKEIGKSAGKCWVSREKSKILSTSFFNVEVTVHNIISRKDEILLVWAEIELVTPVKQFLFLQKLL